LNAFGAAFVKHKGWTKKFCEADSDGDGLTNGEELGDPCCLWGVWDVPSAYTDGFAPSHPGDPSSKLTNYQRPSCDSTKSKVKAPIMGQFNLGEEQKVAKLYTANYTIPMPGNIGKQTTYINIAWNFPDESADLFHIVSADAIVDTKNLHHYVVSGCPNKWLPSQHGRPVSNNAARKCKIVCGGYVPGRNITSLPPWAGMAIGKAAKFMAFVVNIHFDNPKLEKGIVSRDGMVIHYTPTLRKQTLAGFSTMQVSLNPTMLIPAKKHRYFMTRECKLTLTDTATGKVSNAEQRLMSIDFHAHLLGAEMYADRVRGNDRLSLAVETPWYFDDQYDHVVYAKNYTVKTGDILQTSCIFDSSKREKYTMVGLETIDEMCWASFKFAKGGLRGRCDGQIWTGELNDIESGVGLQSKHPLVSADGVWSGTDIKTGGDLVRSTGIEVCADHPLIKQYCPMIVTMVPKANVTCKKTFGKLAKETKVAMLGINQLKNVMPLQACCSWFCKQVCPGDQVCQPPTTTTVTAVSITCSTNCEKCASATVCTKCTGAFELVKGGCQKIKTEVKVVKGSFSVKMPSTNAGAFTSNPKAKEVFQKALASTLGVNAADVIIKDLFVDGVKVGARRLADSNVKVDYEVRTAKVIDSTTMDSTAMATLKSNVEKQAASIGAPVIITELPTATTPKTSSLAVTSPCGSPSCGTTKLPVEKVAASTAAVLGANFLVALSLFLPFGDL